MSRAMATKYPTDMDERMRSLLQKAVRRGHSDLVFTIGSMMEQQGTKAKSWFRHRTALITFEECWPLGAAFQLNRKFYSKVAALVKTALSVKTQDAMGLGYLAYALSRGDQSVLDGGPEDRSIKIVAKATEKPQQFWEWIAATPMAAAQQQFVENAMQFKNAGRPHEQAILRAAAYLAVADGDIPAVDAVSPNQNPFPYWVALDGHTPQGRRAIRDVARDLYMAASQLEWAMFHFEGAQTNACMPSTWWQRSTRWHFQKIGLAAEEAHLLWEPAKSQVMDALAEESRQLHSEIYAWKLAHRSHIQTLKQQVQLYFDRTAPGRQGQPPLF